MEECLAIKPDLIFLWDEAWFGFARFNAFHRRRTAMGAAAALTAQFHQFRLPEDTPTSKRASDLNPADKTLLETRLLPDPTRCASASTRPARRTSRCRRCAGLEILVWDEDFHRVEGCFQEAFLTHTSTSPNPCRSSRRSTSPGRQMELEGYELTMRAAEIAFRIRREVNGHPLISKCFQSRRLRGHGARRVPPVGH